MPKVTWRLRNSAAAIVTLACLTLGCRTMPPVSRVDLGESGWRVCRGQAVWRPNRAAQESAGELVVATQEDGRAFVQFTKEPFPVVTALTDGHTWQVTLMAQRRSWRGRGEPPARWPWLQLARAVAGSPPRAPWQMSRRDPASFSLENPVTGEALTGFLSP